MSNIFLKDRRRRILLWAFALALIIVFLPFVIPVFYVYLLIEILILGLLGLSVNLLLGYSGMISFGHAAFYAIGAYSLGLMVRKAGLPFHVAMVAAPFIAAAFGLVIGFFCVRLSGIYFAMLTLAFGMLIWAIIFKWYDFTGGDNGLVGVEIPSILSSPTAYFYYTVAIFFASLGALRIIVNSPFGYTMKAIRDKPERIRFLGINVTNYQLRAFVISAFFAGLAGALYLGLNRAAYPSFSYWSKSGEALVIILIGGINSFVGPIVGSAVLLLLQRFISIFTVNWYLVLGIVLVLVVLFLPEGVMEIGTKIRSGLAFARTITSVRGLHIGKFSTLFSKGDESK